MISCENCENWLPERDTKIKTSLETFGKCELADDLYTGQSGSCDFWEFDGLHFYVLNRDTLPHYIPPLLEA